MDVIVTGKLTTYPGRSSYQIVIETMKLAFGQGALLKLLEERRRKLADEGLFDEARKKKLPFLPGIIGVVTSPTGAVIRDIMHRIRDRCGCRVLGKCGWCGCKARGRRTRSPLPSPISTP